MSRATVELDFFRMEKESSGKSHFQKLFPRQTNLQGIHNAISKIDPEILKNVIASGSASHISNGKSKSAENFSPTCNPISVGQSAEGRSKTSPMTIFYNGTVFVFDLPVDKADSILKVAVEGSSKHSAVTTFDAKSAVISSLPDQQQLLESLDGDLPLARRKSLHRFLAKRKERLVSVAPYACHNQYAFMEQKAPL